jgi:hypothetical protein
MIKATVYLKNDHESKYQDVEITEEDLIQLACNKARGMYEDGYYNTIIVDDMEVVTKLK